MKKTVFLALSFTKRRKVERAITKFFEDKGFKVRTGRILRSGMPLGNEIIRIIKDCNFGVVVYNELRHNISYEWGLLDALIGKDGHVFLFKDANIHIDIDHELSDKKGVTFTTFYGEDSEEKIIECLKEDEGLMEMIKECISESISPEKSKEVSEVVDAVLNSSLPMKELSNGSKIQKGYYKNLEDKFDRIKNLSAEGHSFKASILFHSEAYEKAEEEFRNAIELDPSDAKNYYNLGTTLNKLKRFDEAKEEFRKAIELDPDYSSAHNSLGAMLVELKRFDEAEEEFRKAIELDPDYSNAHSNLGLILTKIQKFSLAESEYKKAITLNPEDVNSLLNLSELYIILKKYFRSILIAEDALEQSKIIKNKIIAKFLIIVNNVLLNEKSDKEQFLKFLEDNEGYDLDFEFKTLKKALKDSPHKEEIDELIDEVIKYSKKEKD